MIRFYSPVTRSQYDELRVETCLGNYGQPHLLRSRTTRRVRDLFTPRTWWICDACALHEERER